MEVKIKVWAYVQGAKVWHNGVGNIAIYTRKAEAKAEATPNMLKDGKLVKCEITYNT